MATTYDDAREHRGTLPADLPRKAGATHIGMFFAWCALRGLTSEWHGRLDPDRIERLKRREITGRDYVLDYLDGKLEDEHLTPAGQAFAAAYVASGRYLEDYTRVLAADLESPYHVPDGWEAFDELVPTLDAAHGVEPSASPAAGHAVPAAVAPTPTPAPDAQAARLPEPPVEAVPEPETEVGRGIDDYGM
ncbi:MAG: hypothetical protein P1V36_17755, partial [Planctomycetota bacterium]|nr:hypothetical protein [Planctomycetota bacterium]